ncbi:MAG: hypothetical protein IJ688_01910 [Treponema sp.]|nr:hypothetical protein [Treponema sp.]
MNILDKLRYLAGVKPRCVKVIRESEKAIPENMECCCLNCSKDTTKFFIVNKCDNAGKIIDKLNYIAPLCEMHSSVGTIQEVKYKTNFQKA